MYFEHWKHVKESDWRWPNFKPEELACKGTGSLLVDEDALDRLQILREKIGRPIVVVSAYRSQKHNKAVGGASRSYHLNGQAFDISMANHSPNAFEAAAREAGFTGFGFYPRSGFMHIDTGPARTWGTRFPETRVHLAPEPERQPETLKEDTDAIVGVLTGVTAIVAAIGDALGSLPDNAQLWALGGIAAILLVLAIRRIRRLRRT